MYVGDVEDRSNTPKGCNGMYVGDVKDWSNTPKGCNAMYVRDIEDRSNTPKGCNGMYVRDVEDRSNTPKGCNAMYVEDVEDGKRTYTHILAHNFLKNLMDFQSKKSFGKLRLRAFQRYHQILCILKIYYDLRRLRHK